MNSWKATLAAVGLFMLAPDPVLAQEFTATNVVELQYPPLAMAGRVSGILKIKCILAPNGTVVSTEILEAISDINDPALRESRSRGVRQMLGRAAQENAMKWTFTIPDKLESPFTVLTYKFVVKDSSNSPRSRFVFDSPATIQVIAEMPAPQK